MALTSEKAIYFKFIDLKDPVLRPLLKGLDKLGIIPDYLSYLAVALMVLFIFLVGGHPEFGFLLLVIRAFLDGIDGPLARYQGTASVKGKFTDLLMDQLGFAFFVFGVLKAGLIPGLVAAVLVYVTLLSSAIAIVRRSAFKPGDWMTKEVWAGALPSTFTYVAYIVFGIYAFYGHNFMRKTFILLSIILIIKTFVDYRAIKNIKA